MPAKPDHRFSWLGLAAGLLIVLSICLPVGYALFSANGPLDELGQQWNPFAFARLAQKFGAEGSGEGRFDDPRSLAIGPDGSLYIGEYSDGRIQKFDRQGRYQLLWSVGSESVLGALAVDRLGRAFVLQGGRIRLFEAATGAALPEAPIPAGETAPWQHPGGRWFEALDAAPDGSLAAAVNTLDVLRFDLNGRLAFSLAETTSQNPDRGEGIEDLAVDAVGNYYLLLQNEMVLKYSPDGRLLAGFGGDGDEPGLFSAVGAIAVDGQGRIYVSDINGIQVFSPEGRYLARFDPPGYAFDLRFDANGDLWVLTNTPAVFRYQISGN
jgi:hypothetical protein